VAHKHNLSNRQRQSSWMSEIGNQIRTVAEVAGTAHGIYLSDGSRGGDCWTAIIIF
jgi:hypothetical protein